jgi:hypothetical protein
MPFLFDQHVLLTNHPLLVCWYRQCNHITPITSVSAFVCACGPHALFVYPVYIQSCSCVTNVVSTALGPGKSAAEALVHVCRIHKGLVF